MANTPAVAAAAVGEVVAEDAGVVEALVVEAVVVDDEGGVESADLEAPRSAAERESSVGWALRGLRGAFPGLREAFPGLRGAFPGLREPGLAVGMTLA